MRFFVVERQYAPEMRAWLDGLHDERLGRRMKGYGALIWLDRGRVVDADDSVGGPGTDPNLAGRTRRCGDAGGAAAFAHSQRSALSLFKGLLTTLALPPVSFVLPKSAFSLFQGLLTTPLSSCWP